MPEQVFERIERLLDDRGKTQQNLLAALGMNRSTYSNWKLGKSNDCPDTGWTLHYIGCSN